MFHIIFRLKSSPDHAELVDNLLTTWSKLYTSDQSFMIEAVEQINVNPHINATLIKSLKDFSTKLQNQLNSSSVHALIFMETKLLSWYSCRGAIQLSSVDILFLTLLCQRIGSSASRRNSEQQNARNRARASSSVSTVESVEMGTTSSSETCSVAGFDEQGSSAEDEPSTSENSDGLPPGEGFSFMILIKSTDLNVYVPQIVHVAVIQPGIYAAFICEVSLFQGFQVIFLIDLTF